MTALFLKLLNMSISAGWLILAVMVLRLVLKRAPKWINCVLWALVAVRLLCPLSIESALSLLPSSETISSEMVQYAQHPTIHSGIMVIDNAVNPAIGEAFADAPANNVNPLYVWTAVAGIVWGIGVAVLLIYAAVSYLRLRRRVSASLHIQDHIYLCDAISSPFILGVVNPRIYLPSGLNEEQTRSVVAHERAHLARCDHWWKPLGWLLLTVYWFNPLCWAAYILLCRDIEMACDEKVIRDMDTAAKKAYSIALLSCSTHRNQISACPLAFGEVGVKERIKGVLNYKKPAFRVVAVAVIACIAAAVCFLTNPKEEVPDGIELADLDGDGVAERLLTEELTPNERYAVQIIRVDGSTLWSAELGLPHTAWDAYFLYQDNGVNGILRYNPSVFQGYADYSYEIYTFLNGVQTTYASGEVEFNTNPDSENPWPIEAAAFAEEVNALLSRSKLLISTLDGELHQYGDTDIVWNCKSPLSGDNSQAVSYVEFMGLDCWYTEEETIPNFIERTYYAVIPGSDTSFRIAESFGFTIDDHIADLDGDGVTELVCNCQYGADGHESVYVYRRNGNLIERGYLDLEHKQLDMVMPANWKNWGFNSTAERYNPDTGMFEVRYDTDHGTETAAVSHLDHFTFEEYARIPEVTSPTSITAKNLFASMPATFHFLSGAGGWQTELYWNGDGTFSGIYEDADVSEIYRCLFMGSMDAPRKIGDLEFSTRVTALDYEKSNTVAYENGQKIVSAEPYGLDDVDEIRIYLPGCSVSKLPQAAVDWLRGGAEEFWDGQGPKTLPFFVLYNVRGQQAFFSADWSAFSETSSSRPEQTDLNFVVEGLEESIPAYLFRDLEYSLYIPHDGWQYHRILEHDMLAKCWISTINPDVSLTVRHLGYRNLVEAQEWEREQNTGFQLMEDKQGGIGGTDGTGRSMLEVFFYSGQNAMYAVELRYPVEATEGFGTLLQVMADTFLITKPAANVSINK